MSTKHVTCRYFLHGVCREGNRCLFSHDPNTSKPSTICKFYQRGACAYGERCRYDHIRYSPRGGAESSSEDQASGRGGFGIPARGGGGIPARGRGGVKKTPVLRDRVLTVDNTFGSPVDSLKSEVTAAAAAPHSYVDAIRAGLDASAQEQAGGAYQGAAELCPYAAAGRCFDKERCTYLHGDECDVCGREVLHPHDPEERRLHRLACMMAFETNMSRAFAAQRSQDKVCSICMEVVVQKLSPSERRFGILSSCCHTFCLACIRKWRCTRTFSNDIIKACPECRMPSEFVIPSQQWVEDQEDKDQLIELYKSGISKKPCKYFDQGRGSCPFGGRCLYRHAFPDGTRPEPERPRKQLNSEGNVRFMNSTRLWDFIEERDRVTSPNLFDDITEMGELFMQLSVPSHEEPETPTSPDQ